MMEKYISNNVKEVLSKFARNPVVYDIMIDDYSPRIYIRPHTRICIVDGKIFEGIISIKKEHLPAGVVVNENNYISRYEWKIDNKNASEVLIDVLDYSNKIIEKNNIKYIDIPKRKREDLLSTLERELRRADFFDIDLSKYLAPHYRIVVDGIPLDIMYRKIKKIDNFITKFYNSVVEATKRVDDPLESALIIAEFINNIYKVKKSGLGWFFDIPTYDPRIEYDKHKIFRNSRRFICLEFIERFSNDKKN